jgi:cobalt-zinc-cadmium efflux system protein
MATPGTAGGHGHDHHAHHGHDHHDHRPAAKGAAAVHPAGHDHDHDLKSTPLSRLGWALGITASFMLVEAGVGWWSKSLALLADAGHMLSDAAALALAIVAQRVASQTRTRARTYGFRRAEVLAAFANGIALAVTAIWIFIEAASRWRDPPVIQGTAMTVTAALGLVVNLGAAVMLGVGGHGHNVNTRAALAHVLTDALGSVGAIVAGVLVLVFGWNRADPLMSSLIGVLVLWGGWRLVRDTSHVLMEGSPIEIDIAHLEETLRSVPGVVDFHDLHVWSISDGFDVLTVHVVLAKGYHGTEVVASVSRALLEKHKLDHCTIQPEPPREEQLITIGRKAEPA